MQNLAARDGCNNVGPGHRLRALRCVAVSTTTLAHRDSVSGGRQRLHLDWYALRWKIETFFRTLKTRCRIEELRLATADRLANCIALCCVVAWRVSWPTMLSREAPKASPTAVVTDAERHLLERTTPKKQTEASARPRFLFQDRRTARSLSRPHLRCAPGTTVIWRGLSRLADLVEGARIAESSPPGTCG